MFRVVGLVVLMVLVSAAARGQSSDSAARQAAREHYQKGSVAYELGHYDTAITEYEAAYRAFNEPTLLYNLGQAHRLARHLTEALHFYKMYLIKVPDAPNRADVEARIDALQTAIAQAPAAPSPPVAATPQPVSPPPVQEASQAAVEPAPVATSTTDHGRSLKIAGLVVGIAGLGLVGGGVGAGLVAKNAGDDISRANANHQPFDTAEYAIYQNDQIVAGVLIGVGVAAVVSGVTMAIVGVRRGHRAMAMQVTPRLGSGHANLSANIRF
jgi:tetratricopeptide (TPR) repeat protein